MIDYVAIGLSVVALAFSAYAMRRDARRFDAAERGPIRFARGVQAAIKRHEDSSNLGGRTSVGYVKNIMANAERESAKVKFIK